MKMRKRSESTWKPVPYDQEISKFILDYKIIIIIIFDSLKILADSHLKSFMTVRINFTTSNQSPRNVQVCRHSDDAE